MSSTLGRAALVVSGGILASRVLGFLREMVLAGLLGRTIEADLYQAAFTIPDYISFLMAGGYLTITFVPIISRHLAAGDAVGANRSFTAVSRVVGALMLGVTVATLVAAEPLTERLFPEIPADRIPELVALVRIILPAQFFFVLGSLLMAVQYAHRRFLIPALAPVIYNVAIIAGGLISWALGDPGPAGFVWGALTGAIIGNFALQWWGARQVGTRLQSDVPILHDAVPEYFALAFPLMIGQSAVALDEVFVRVFGQLGDTGDIAALAYARRVNLLPVGVIAQAAGVASYPFLARLFAEGKVSEVRETVSRTIRASLIVAGIGTAGVVGLALPIIQIAFQRGQFDPADTAATSVLLAIYGLSIPMWAVHQVYTRGFYAQRRMWLPVGVGTAVTVVAIPAYLVGAATLGAAGVAWASVAVMGLYALAIGWWWHREQPGGEMGATLGRMLVATVPAALAGWLATRGLMGGEPSSTGLAVAALLGGGGLTVAVYWGLLRLLRAPELRLLRR
ncbi:MAG TPA: murein biosynthesis integral membrane protein MurJ [Acidimicrobiia bacterium]|nr:murein biosynthesis integral membrane protein MurJ [Acidimicrobiia bacterium]